MGKLQDLRKGAGLTQKELADEAGMKCKILQQYEIGYRHIDGARLETLISLANALNCQIYELLEDEKLRKLMRDYEESIVNE